MIDLPDSARQDPTFARTHGETYGRDGCRVPIPWEADAPAYGFNDTGASWLPQPESWGELARDRQVGVDGSTLELYRSALALRRLHHLAEHALEWLPSEEAEVLRFRVGDVVIAANTGTAPAELPSGGVLLASGDLADGRLPADTTVWVDATV